MISPLSPPESFVASAVIEPLTNLAILDKLELLDNADAVAWRHFPETYSSPLPSSTTEQSQTSQPIQPKKQYVMIDQWGNPVPIAATEMGASSPYNPSRLARDEYHTALAATQSSNLSLSTQRPRYQELYAEPIKKVSDHIANKLEDIARAIIDVALGTKCIRHNSNGEEIDVYDRPPDYRAAANLLDRIMGRPTEYKEIESTLDAQSKVLIYIPDNQRPISFGDDQTISPLVPPTNGTRPLAPTTPTLPLANGTDQLANGTDQLANGTDQLELSTAVRPENHADLATQKLQQAFSANDNVPGEAVQLTMKNIDVFEHHERLYSEMDEVSELMGSLRVSTALSADNEDENGN